VTLTEVAFEGNFISVQAVTENGTVLVSEIRNDGTANIPAPGSKLYMTFDARNASILPDSTTAKR
jgi:spermidine/putrescine transport system ATP-binding protein